MTKQIKLTRDEARLFSYFLTKFNYELNDDINWYTKEEASDCIKMLSSLNSKIEEVEKDNRRTGRKTQDGFVDMLRRLIKKHKSTK